MITNKIGTKNLHFPSFSVDLGEPVAMPAVNIVTEKGFTFLL